MIVGYEWLIDAKDCNMNALRDLEALRACFERIISDLKLKTIGDGTWHKFDSEGGVTGLVMLTESHLACHTYPEYGTATFNLYCCRERPEWDWKANLHDILGAKSVVIKKIERGTGQYSAIKVRSASIKKEVTEFEDQLADLRLQTDDTESQIQVKSRIVGGED